jgi:integrase/recombinase XerC
VIDNADELQRYADSWTKCLLNARSLSLNTVMAYASDLKLFVNFLRNYNAEDVSIEHLKNLEKRDMRAWFLRRKERGESSRTIARGLSALKSFLKYMVEIEVITGSDILSMRPPRIAKSLPRPLSVTQINGILNVIHDVKQTEWIIKRDRAILLLIYSVGLRISEALSLDKIDITCTENFMTISGKGGKKRRVPIIEAVRNVILEYLDLCEFPEAKALFINKFGNRISKEAIQKLVRKARTLLGLSDNVTPHALRHSCATHLMESSGDLRSIQELLGHSSISSTQIYADVAQKYVSDIYEKCHPLSNGYKKRKV